ncbi:hypothetical protein SLEP1_g12285 [Rubroshorea leprosula]|uniref:Uncharacterized protein n=1 Tax=Rubroshorea leprosula TaxID=152421 RepID=A0AAV5IK16_9ROSI|nr:hypothetical protein SLEP1_g12285 [Rubroshorea leprosula]
MNRKLTVAEAGRWNGSSWSWNIQRRRDPRDREAEELRLMQAMLGDTQMNVAADDEKLWRFNRSSGYTVEGSLQAHDRP